MPVQLDTGDRDFDRNFAAFLATKREASEDVDAAVRAIIAQVRREGDAALVALTQKFDRLDLGQAGIRVSEAEIAAAVSACDGRYARRARAGARPHRKPSPAAAAPRRQLHRRTRSRAGLALDGGGVGRALRAGRSRQLSELRAHECRAGQGGRRAARRHGGSLARRRDESAGAGGSAPRRRHGNLPHRRRAGRGGAGLRHRDDQAGRQDRRARQRLCRRGQAAGVRHRRHRLDCRPLRSPGDRRQQQRSGMAGGRSARTGRARHRRPSHPDDRRCGFRPVRRCGRRAPAPATAARQYRGRELGDLRRRDRAALARRGARARRPHRRRARRDRHRRSGCAGRAESAMPAPSSWAPTRPR